MKLAIIVTLAILALCCSPASAEICQSFADIIQGLFLGTPASFEAAVEPFKPDADMKAAATQLKTLVDLLPKNTKDSIFKLMVHGFLHSHCLAVDCPSPWMLFGPFCNPERTVTM
uniref:Uteroglobin n=1 Tax=Equus asinus TaxID=9793 RepID=A0A8C4MM26_EQUAS